MLLNRNRNFLPQQNGNYNIGNYTQEPWLITILEPEHNPNRNKIESQKLSQTLYKIVYLISFIQNFSIFFVHILQ